jgi:hypothetical protein
VVPVLGETVMSVCPINLPSAQITCACGGADGGEGNASRGVLSFRVRAYPDGLLQNATVAENTAVLPAMDDPSLVEEKLGWR